jgi:hypothetical protein
VKDDTHAIAAQIHFCLNNGVATSPCRAPFGSMEFAGDLAPESLWLFWNDVEVKLRESGANKIIIKDIPHQYRPQQSALLSVLLLDSGFRLASQEVNSAIRVDDNPWENKISHAERKRLRRCREEALEFHCFAIEKMDEVYHFIQACREERGMTLSMTLPQLKNTLAFCPKDFSLFGVLRESNLVAASIAVKVNGHILYDFYHAHAKAADQLSPVVALIDGMYSYCREKHFDLLDLGTSATDGKINFSLLNFKTQTGGETSLKLTFEKDLY